jgi:hypothetical protein
VCLYEGVVVRVVPIPQCVLAEHPDGFPELTGVRLGLGWEFHISD